MSDQQPDQTSGQPRPGRNPERRLPAGHPERGEGRPATDPPKRAEARHRQGPQPAQQHKPARGKARLPRITAPARPAEGLPELVRDYFRILFDLRFTRYLTVQLLPLLYVVLVIGGIGVIGQLVWDAFGDSAGRGLTFLLASPFAVLVWASACRAATEFLLVVFRMSEDVHRLAGIRPTVDKLGELMNGGNWFSRLMSFSKTDPRADAPPRGDAGNQNPPAK
ncbi:DUF4282 domain-containing protein [Amnimonas aquatica]|uniref:DUF4282 domain-containing protein n=1 Tax=Amnimonas aquatica TaxID=2094561 RepID=A0A2P6AUJ5_9GAMM|nr:DUF4282 domain-containing protein [Amnimonas aquatica]PQA50198.1 hypothetical protein C5O18_01830 [Amnimonas aquatica]